MNIIEKFNRCSEKDKIVLKNTMHSFMVKGVSLCISLFTMPVYMRFFSDNAVLGVWFTILSVLTWVLSFDLGIGNGLRNKLALALTQKDYRLSRELISSAYWMVGFVTVLLLLAGGILIPATNWNSLFNIPGDLVPALDLRQAVFFAFLGIALQFFFKLTTSVVYAIQKSAINDLVWLVVSALQFLFALAAPCGTPVQNLKMFSFAYIFCSNVPFVVAAVYVFSTELKGCLPSIRFFNRKTAKSVLTLGGIFFVCQILYMLITNTNEFFISRFTGPENVVSYQIYNKLFTLIATLVMLALTPIWSASSKAIGEKDFLWLRKLNRNVIKLSLAAILLEFLMIPFLQLLMNLWLGRGVVVVDYKIAFVFALYGSTMIYQAGVSTITNGLGRIKIQAVCFAIGVAVKFLVIYIGVALTGRWTVVVLANAIILMPYCIAQQIDLNRFIRKGIVSLGLGKLEAL